MYVDPVSPAAGVVTGIRLAQAVGFDDVWFGDHTRSFLPEVAWDPATNPMARLIPNLDAYLDPTVLIARHARRFGLPMGVSVTDAVRRTPADLARAWMSLHHVTGGRAVLGIGSGEWENTGPYGHSLKQSVSRLEDTLAALRAVWASEGKPVSHVGPFHEWEDATFGLASRTGAFPPIWVAAEGPKSCGIAGRYGDGWLMTHKGLEAWGIAARQVAAGATAAGRDPESMQRSMIMAPVLTRDAGSLERACGLPLMAAVMLALPAAHWAQAGAHHPLGDDYTDFNLLDPSKVTPEVIQEAQRQATPDMVRQLLSCGTGAEVAEHLREFVAQGLKHVILINFMPACGARLGLESIVELRSLVKRLKAMQPGALA